MEAYVDQVRDVQALDTLPVRKEPVSLPAFFDQQEGEYIMLAGRHGGAMAGLHSVCRHFR